MTARQLFLRLLRWLFGSLLLITVVFSAFAGWTFANCTSGQVHSRALGQTREYQLYFNGGDRYIYILDGQMDRNSWIAATFYLIGSSFRAQSPPTVVAIHSDENRDIDFRNAEGSPTSWRPSISGRATDFDVFLIDELLPEVEGKSDHPRERVLSGFSLSGLYALEFATRDVGVFDHVQAFSPTISHDVTITQRLLESCDQLPETYVSWGLESGRDTEVTLDVFDRVQADPNCANAPITFRRHYGIMHQLIMVSGHFERAFWL